MKSELLRVWRRLAMLSPEVSTQTTGRALREYLCGDYGMLAHWFDLSRRDFQFLSRFSRTERDRLVELAGLLDRMGVPAV